ncbi:MAG: hypothetical protein AAFY66_19785, partial [Pseudomonadota bacterium]
IERHRVATTGQHRCAHHRHRPNGLAQAVMMLAADFHARRGTERDGDVGLPQAVIALTQAWRPGRL